MLTTCPECQTTFRVTQEHLGLRRGLVRCGHCAVVFNAYDSLLAELVTPPVEPEKAARGSAPVAPSPAPSPAPPSAPVAAPPDLPDSAATTDATPEDSADSVDEPVVEAVEAPPPSAVIEPPEETPARETSESILLSELPTRVTPPRRPRPAYVHLKLAVAILLAATLLLQGLVFLRADLAAVLPGARPLLARLCEPFGCAVPLPRQLDKTAITASSLEHDAENRSRSRLSLLLANRSGQAQTWPHIVLILTDMRDSPVAQRVFSPREYLAGGIRPEAGMAADEELEIRLDLDTGTLAATGYALDLAYR